MNTKLQLIFLLLAVASRTDVIGVHSHSCVPPAGPNRPGVPPPVCRGLCDCSTANCPGGLVTGVCGCDCAVCAKQESECCGGWRDYQGKCDVGLVCRPFPPGPQPPPPPGPGGFPPSIPGGIPNPGECVQDN